MPICTQGMQRTWWPEAGTIIVTGPYYTWYTNIIVRHEICPDSQLQIYWWFTNISRHEFCDLVYAEMCRERDSPLEPFVLPAPGHPELAWLTCGAHLGPPVLTRKQMRPRVNSLVCDRAAAFCAAGPPEVLSRVSRPVTQATECERELTRARSQRLKLPRACQASRFLMGSPIETL